MANLVNITHKLDKPKAPSDKVVILLPGISGGATSSRYDLLSSSLTSIGFNFLRLDLWESEAALNNLCISEIHGSLGKAVNFMKEEGCTEISFIGMSFGGGVLLTYKNPSVNKMVLLAPAIKFGNESNFAEAKNGKISEFKHFMEIKISKNDVASCPILVFHGTKDDVVPIENSMEICRQLGNCKLERLEDAGHYYEEGEVAETIIKKIIIFLKSS